MATPSFALEIDRFRLIPFSLSSSLSACPCRPFSSKTLIFSRPCSRLNRVGLLLHRSANGVLRFGPNDFTSCRHVITAVARADPDRLGEEGAKQETGGSEILPIEDDSVFDSQQKATQFNKRIVFGLGIGISVCGVVLAGGWLFTVALAAAVFVGAREYFELVRSRGITAGMTPPPHYVSRACSVICALMPILTMYLGQIDVSVTSAAFIVATALLLQRGIPRFAQLSSAIFGLFYCGYLPCFWVKLRCALAAPALNTRIGDVWPIVLGGQTHWTVGLVATLITISSVIAADTFAFLGGKAYGRTPLTSISPKKTWEGIITGFCGCIVTSVVLSKVFNWPTSLPRYSMLLQIRKLIEK